MNTKPSQQRDLQVYHTDSSSFVRCASLSTHESRTNFALVKTGCIGFLGTTRIFLNSSGISGPSYSSSRSSSSESANISKDVIKRGCCCGIGGSAGGCDVWRAAWLPRGILPIASVERCRSMLSQVVFGQLVAANQRNTSSKDDGVPLLKKGVGYVGESVARNAWCLRVATCTAAIGYQPSMPVGICQSRVS